MEPNRKESEQRERTNTSAVVTAVSPSRLATMANQKRHNRTCRRKEFEGDCQSPLGMGTLLKKFTEDQQVKNFSINTVETRRKQCNDFIAWCEARSLTRVDQVTRPILQRYQRHLFYYRTKEDRPLSFRSQLHKLSSVRVWYAWLTRNNYLLSNPPVNWNSPKLAGRFPASFFHRRSGTRPERSRCANALGHS